MNRPIVACILTLSLASAAANDPSANERRASKDSVLGKKASSASPDKSLAGDITRKKEHGEAAPALQYDQFRLGVELQVASKRHEQIEDLKKIIGLNPDPKEIPDLLFRLGELYWEESKFYFFEGNRKDDDRIRALNAGDKAAAERAVAEKAEQMEKSKEFIKLAIEKYSDIIKNYKDYKRSDEVLYFLGHNLIEAGEEKKALVAYNRLIEKYPKSKYLPDAYLARGEFYFNNSKGRREMLETALEAYKKAASYPESQVYGFALYKEGWCYFNLTQYQKSMDLFKAVVLYGELAGEKAIERDGGKSGKGTLVREARADFVRAYSRSPTSSPTDARAEFSKVATKDADRFLMLKQLANLYYDDGKDREAALTFNILIRERPLSPEAPGFQGKIVDCVLRAGNKKMTVEQVRRLVKIMQDVEKASVVKEEKDKKAIEEARELSERTLSNLAVNWHNEAKKTRDDETFLLASQVYSDYLTLFPDVPKAYDLRFFWAELLNDNLQKYDRAADEYTRVLLVDIKRIESSPKGPDGKPTGKGGKWMVNAAYNAILAYDEVVKRAEESGKLKSETSSDITKKLPIPAEKKALLDACERYVKYVPNGEKRVEVAFKAANIYYRHNYLDEAVLRFSDIALNSPEYKFESGDRAGELAANLVLDSFNLLHDYVKVNEWARRFYAQPKLAVGKFREDLSKLIEQSSFKLINQLEAKNDFEKAADSYVAFVAEFPKSDIADKALYNASIDFTRAKMLDKAIETRERVMSSYPKSEYAPACMYANSESLETIGDFEEAAKAYETYAIGYEKSLDKAEKAARAKKGRSKSSRHKVAEPQKPAHAQTWDEAKAQNALINAGVFREGLAQYRQAQRDRERYLELWPDSKDAEKVFLSIADLEEKSGAYGRALKQLEEYEKRYIKDPNKVLTGEGRIADMYERKMKRPREAFRIYQRAMKYYDKLPRATRKNLDNAAVETVARAHYATSEEEFRKFLAVRVRWGKLPHPDRDFKATLQDKSRALANVQRVYTETVNFKAGDPAICALYKIGMAYDNLAEVLANPPVLRGAPAEFQDAVRDELSSRAQPVKDKASEAFVAAVTKSHELDIYNDCSSKALRMLREKYKPDQFPQMYEERAELKDVKNSAVGADLLASIQPLPPKRTPRKDKPVEDFERDFDRLGKVQREKPAAKDEAALPAATSATTATSSEPAKKRRRKEFEEPEDLQ